MLSSSPRPGERRRESLLVSEKEGPYNEDLHARSDRQCSIAIRRYTVTVHGVFGDDTLATASRVTMRLGYDRCIMMSY